MIKLTSFRSFFTFYRVISDNRVLEFRDLADAQIAFKALKNNEPFSIDAFEGRCVEK